MNPLDVKALLKTVGVSSWMITGAIVVAAGFYVYKTFLETTQLKLEIKLLKKEVGE